MTELSARVEGEDPAASRVAPAALAALVGMVAAARSPRARRVRSSTGSSPRAGTRPRSSRPRASAAMGGGDELEPVVQAALDANPDAVEKLRAGNMKPIGAIVGHVMRETKGRADGGEVTRIVREKLSL